jgi:S1-C subfamily serine protease
MKRFFGFVLLLLPFTFYAQVDSVSVKISDNQKNYVQEKMRFDAKLMKENPTQQNILNFEKQNELQEIKIQPSVKEHNQGWYQASEAFTKKVQTTTVVSPNVITVKSVIISKDNEGATAKGLSIDPSEDGDYAKNSKRLNGPSQYDSRIELFQLDPNIYWQFVIFQKSESIGMIVEKEKLNQVSKTIYKIDTSQTLGSAYNLCATEAFYKQPIVGSGTAFIYSENSMITAKHVFERPITDYVVIFGYRIIQSDGMVEDYFDAENVYYPKKVLHQVDELDVVEFAVDRKLDRPVLEWEDSSQLSKKNSEIYMLGHPSGLPLKVALNASIQDRSNPLYYYTSLDSFQGNSGSPVFNFYTNKVIGILVAGEIDYQYNGNCYYSPKCKIPYCKGEKVIRIEEVVKQF